MATANRDLFQSLICGICEERARKPKTAGACKHTYCKKCIHDWILHQRLSKTFPCPQCQENCNRPNSGAEGLKDNKIGKAFTVYLDLSKENNDEKVKFCDPCKFRNNSTEATHYCGGCDGIYLCRSCYEVHNLCQTTARHDIAEICQPHSKVFKQYCLDCGKFACMLCVRFDHCTNEHHLKPYKDVLASAVDEQMEASSKAKNALTALKEEKARIHEIDEVVEKKHELWIRSIERNLFEKLQEYDQKIDRLKQERKECEEKASGATRIIRECLEMMNDTKREIVELERHLCDAIKKGEAMRTNGVQTYVTLQEEFLEPTRNLMKEAGEGGRFRQCQERVKKIQDALDQSSVHRDTELKIVSLDDASVCGKIKDLHTALLHDLGKAIYPRILQKVKGRLDKHTQDTISGIDDVSGPRDLHKHTQDTISGIDDVSGLWDFMKKHSHLAPGCYDALKAITKGLIPEIVYSRIASAEETIAVLTDVSEPKVAPSTDEISLCTTLNTSGATKPGGTIPDDKNLTSLLRASVLSSLFARAYDPFDDYDCTYFDDSDECYQYYDDDDDY